MLHLICWQSPRFEFDKFGDKAPLIAPMFPTNLALTLFSLVTVTTVTKLFFTTLANNPLFEGLLYCLFISVISSTSCFVIAYFQTEAHFSPLI